MRYTSSSILLCLLLSAVACSSDSEPDAATAIAGAPRADIVFTEASIHTLDPAAPRAEVLAVRGQTIMYVGSRDGLDGRIGPNTRVVPLEGKMILPGFQDAHVHPIDGGMDYQGCPLFDIEASGPAYASAVEACAGASPGGGWIVGSGWLVTAFSPSGIPHKSVLDARVPDRPVALWSADGHTLWTNSKAMEIAGITRGTPDPPNGRIDRDPDTGEAVGGFQESATDLIEIHFPPTTDEVRDEALAFAVQRLNRLGITAWQDASVDISPDSPFRELQTYQRAARSGSLTMHVVESLLWVNDRGLDQIEDLLDTRARYDGPETRANTVKIFLDGVIESQTAALLEDYTDRPGYRSSVQVEPDMLKAAVARLDAEGFQVHIHVIGDAAVRTALDAFEHARNVNGPSGNRHHLAHVQLVDPDDIGRFAALDVTANFQPLWAWEDEYLSDLTLPRIGPDRYRWIYPMRSILDAGGRIAFGSDWTVSSADPLLGIEVAVTRMDPDGESNAPFIPEERLSLQEAIRAYTINAAWLNRLEDRTGSLEAGKLADLIVLDRDLFSIPPAEISEAKVLLTLFQGRAVHGTLDELAGR